MKEIGVRQTEDSPKFPSYRARIWKIGVRNFGLMYMCHAHVLQSRGLRRTGSEIQLNRSKTRVFSHLSQRMRGFVHLVSPDTRRVLHRSALCTNLRLPVTRAIFPLLAKRFARDL